MSTMGSSKRQQQLVLSRNTQEFKEKYNLKSADKALYVKELEDKLKNMKDERSALRVGNACLTTMTHGQIMMPLTINAEIFAGKKEKNRMQMVPLQDSIKLNSTKLFLKGKRLLTADNMAAMKTKKLMKSKEDLEAARLDAHHEKHKYEQRIEAYLHKQAMVEDSLDREGAAKVLHKKLDLIFDELNKNNFGAPKRLDKLQKQVVEMKSDLKELSGLKDRAHKYSEVEAEALTPVNKEIHAVSSHFAELISKTRNEIELRKKSGQLAKFLAGREANPISYNDVPTGILNLQIKKRAQMVSFLDVIEGLKDAFLVSDIDHVVDCFLDHLDVRDVLLGEKQVLAEKNRRLKQTLRDRAKTKAFLRYDGADATRNLTHYNDAVEEETDMLRMLEQRWTVLKKQDVLMAQSRFAVQAILSKLRPIPTPQSQDAVTGKLTQDMDIVIGKMEAMLHIIRNNTVPIGPVKPNMLNLFRVERLPSDTQRCDLCVAEHSSMTSIRSFAADAPGFPNRHMIKQKSRMIYDQATQHKTKEKRNSK